jgi:hypothetical protein
MAIVMAKDPCLSLHTFEPEEAEENRQNNVTRMLTSLIQKLTADR